MKRKWQHDRGLEARMLLTIFLLAVVYLAFLAILASQGAGMVTMLVFISGFMLLQYFFSDRLVLKSMGARVVSETEEPELHQMVSRLCAMADLPKPRIAVVETGMPNAFATGRSPNNSVVAVTTGIRRQLSPAELEAVLAHELTHIKNRDVMVMTIASFLSTVAFFIVRNSLFFGGAGSGRGRGGIAVAFLVSAVVWIISSLLIRSLSRYREFAADRGAAVITGQPSNLASALMKISGVMPRIPKEDLRKAEGMNAFFIIPAVSGSSIMNLLSTHPPVEKRIAALERIGKDLGTA
ncbi:zinc metalloprotease HtpX [Candidatus Methanocrinis natronophilus]|uniref:Protease HtpX homolog n=1 Tax=Candidatus Methanocrinis natronophilus TaxID=3033396 RepID=A0ABT5X7P0_9EURY|nr:zinc metalloprotease HtpX [Candidatus Methanocrinis natronophilus]MDF0590714.1 zinc metalloprotease HtpX [Candidatus Methanocrinis natronophilus]